jgi:hypothetical protein
MLAQLIIGSMVIVATVAIQAEMFGLMTRRHEPVLTWTRHRFRRMAGTVFISIAMLMVLATNDHRGLVVGARADCVTGAVRRIGASGLFLAGLLHHAGLWRHHPAHREWRLLSALIGANGFLMFGWSTAFMVELIRKSR